MLATKTPSQKAKSKPMIPERESKEKGPKGLKGLNLKDLAAEEDSEADSVVEKEEEAKLSVEASVEAAQVETEDLADPGTLRRTTKEDLPEEVDTTKSSKKDPENLGENSMKNTKRIDQDADLEEAAKIGLQEVVTDLSEEVEEAEMRDLSEGEKIDPSEVVRKDLPEEETDPPEAVKELPEKKVHPEREEDPQEEAKEVPLEEVPIKSID